MFDKEIEKLYNVIDAYLQGNKQDPMKIRMLSNLLLWIEQEYLPKLEQEMFGYSEITQSMLYTESQWEELLSNTDGLRAIMSNLKRQDTFLMKMSKFVEGLL